MDNIIRLGIALSIFLVMILWEAISPKRDGAMRPKRWPLNLGLAVTNILVMKLSIGALAWLSAVHAQDNGWGLLNQIDIAAPIGFVISLLVLDLAIYAQHVLTHHWPLLWRLHQIHHSDFACDATTAVRFHPLEILLSMLYKAVCILIVGADPTAVIIFEIILNGAATFNHSNINLPAPIDRSLRWLIVTPDMHRIHHSTVRSEMDSNYGFSISLWDRLFRTYTADPAQPQQTMAIGLPGFRPEQQRFGYLLRLPWKPLKRG